MPKFSSPHNIFPERTCQQQSPDEHRRLGHGSGFDSLPFVRPEGQDYDDDGPKQSCSHWIQELSAVVRRRRRRKGPTNFSLHFSLALISLSSSLSFSLSLPSFFDQRFQPCVGVLWKKRNRCVLYRARFFFHFCVRR